MPKTKKPDIDNLTKAILDALNGIAWNDDAQVAQITAKKVWSIQDQ
jgi:Holliday junction resolvase RusA-like endonuclease